MDNFEEMTNEEFAEWERKHNAEIQQEREEKKRQKVLSEIFPHYREKTLDNFEADSTELADALDVVRHYVKDIREMKAVGRGITFVGENGVGKTHLACAVLREAGLSYNYRIGSIELAGYIDLYMRMFQLDRDDDEFFPIFDRIAYLEGRSREGVRGAQYLLLDDLGREHESKSGWSNERVFDVMRYRHNRNLPTIITTNVPVQELTGRYTEGMSSFLQEATVIIPMEGEDYRWREER